MHIAEGLSHVYMHVSDIDRSVRFYQEVFGLELIYDEFMEGPDFDTVMGIENARCRTVGGRVGDMRLEFINTSWNPTEKAGLGVGSVGITFQVLDAEEAQKQCVAMGVPTSGAPNETFGVRIFFAEDPDGQSIEIVEYLPGTPAWGNEGARRELVALRA